MKMLGELMMNLLYGEFIEVLLICILDRFLKDVRFVVFFIVVIIVSVVLLVVMVVLMSVVFIMMFVRMLSIMFSFVLLCVILLFMCVVGIRFIYGCLLLVYDILVF